MKTTRLIEMGDSILTWMVSRRHTNSCIAVLVFVSSLFSECVYSQPVPAKVDAYADLPPEVREQFAKQVAAMRLFHLEFSDLWFESGFVGGSQARRQEVGPLTLRGDIFIIARRG